MKHVLTGIVAAVVAAGVMSFTPDAASAKRSSWGVWGGGPSVGIYVGPRDRYYGPRSYRKYGYRSNRYWRDSYAYGGGPRWKYRDRYYD